MSMSALRTSFVCVTVTCDLRFSGREKDRGRIAGRGFAAAHGGQAPLSGGVWLMLGGCASNGGIAAN
jgi:hypothetical protein